MRAGVVEEVERGGGVPTGRMIGWGAVLGLGWGLVMRAWMRFISTDPEFSWTGTIAIIAVAAFAGAVLGLARARRQRGGRGWWRLSLVALLPLGAGGAVMWPSVVAWGAALGRRRPGSLVALLTAAGALVQIEVIRGAILGDWRRGTFAAVVAVTWYLVMLGIQAWGFSVAFARGVPGVTMTRWKQALVAVAMAAVAGLSVMVIGIAG